MARIISICNQKGGVGKCLAPETPVMLASGETVFIEELFNRHFTGGTTPILDDEGGIFIEPKTGLSLLSLDKDLKLVNSKVSNLYRGTAEQILEVKTKRGKEVGVTKIHPLLILRDGSPLWVRAEELRVGDFIATPRQIPVRINQQNINLVDYLPEDIYIKTDRTDIEIYWKEILKNSRRNLPEMILSKLAEGPLSALEFNELSDKSSVCARLKKLRQMGLVKRIPVGRTYEYSVNKKGIIDFLHKSGISAAVFRDLNFDTNKISRLTYRPNFFHECPPISKIVEIDEELARFVSIIMAEGYVGSTRIVLNNTSSVIINVFTDFCEKIGLEYSKRKVKNQWVVRVNGAGTLMHLLNRIFGLPVYGTRKSSKVKVPDLILKSPDNVLASYLGMYIDGEGYIARDRSTLEISSASKDNIIRLHYGFLRFGILSSISSGIKWASNSPSPKPRMYHRIIITGSRDLKILKDKIPICILEKKRKIESASLFKNNTNNDVIPIGSLLKQVRQRLGVFQNYLGVQGTVTDYEDGSVFPSRQALSNMLTKISSIDFPGGEDEDIGTLPALSQSDIFWDRVKSINKKKYDGYVYDLTIDSLHNFIAGNGAFIVHNTTTSINIAAYLAAMGKYVLLVDLDSQANATVGLGVNIADNGSNVYHSLVNDLNPQLSIKKTSLFGFDIFPAAQSLAGATVELVTMDERETRLKKVLNSIRTNYDYILIDCPPSLGLLTVNALAASEHVVIPVQCEYFALEGLSQLLNTINLVRQGLNPDLQVLGVLLTMYDKRNQLSRQVLNEVNKNFPGRIFNAVIPRLVSLAEAPSYGKTILQFDPGSRAARSYRQLAEEVIRLTS